MLSESEKEESYLLLMSLAMHVDYDSGVTGTKFTGSPSGRVPTGPNGFWTKGVASLEENGELTQLVRDIDNFLKQNKGDGDFGILPIEDTAGSLWQRIQSNFERPPDIIRDVIAPMIESEITIG